MQVFHGTNPVAHASAIARKGPDFTRIGGTHGASLGRGFYTSDDVNLASSYAKGTGAICVCRALQGNIKSQKLNSAETAGSLFKAGFHSVHEQGSKQIVLFHPDSVCVSYVVNQGPDTSMAEQLAIAKEQMDKEHDEQDLVRLTQLEVCLLTLQLPCTVCCHVCSFGSVVMCCACALVTLLRAVLSCAVLSCAVPCHTVLCRASLRHALPCCAVPFPTVLCCGQLFACLTLLHTHWVSPICTLHEQACKTSACYCYCQTCI